MTHPRQPQDPAPEPFNVEGEVARAQERRIRQLEERLAERARTLDLATRALAREVGRREAAQAALLEAQKAQAVGHLVGGLAHDLRNVLNTLALGLKVLDRQGEDPALRQAAESGRRALAQGDGLVRTLLEVMRPGPEGGTDIIPGPWLAGMADLLGHAAGEQCSLLLQAAGDVWPIHVPDPGLGAALINLVANARDALPGGGPIRVGARNLAAGEPRPAGAPGGDLVVFTVQDEGSGMGPEVAARVTEPFFTTKGQEGGTGLGLHMVERFMRAAGGFLAIESHPEAGTRVDLFFPRTGGLPVGSGPSKPPAGLALVVEDDDLIRPALAGLLREQGFQVRTCPGAEAALALAPSLPRLALVAARLELPGLDGPTLVQTLRQERPGLAAILASALPGARSPLPGVPLLALPWDRESLGAALAALPQACAPPGDEVVDRLLVRIKSPALLGALLRWREGRRQGWPPRPEALPFPEPGLEDWGFRIQVDWEGRRPAFRYQALGRGLRDRLGKDLRGLVLPDPEEALGSQAGIYRRAAVSCQPAYDHARFRLGGAPPVAFQRLVLPLAEGGNPSSHLVGYALFDGLVGPSERHP